MCALCGCVNMHVSAGSCVHASACMQMCILACECAGLRACVCMCEGVCTLACECAGLCVHACMRRAWHHSAFLPAPLTAAFRTIVNQSASKTPVLKSFFKVADLRPGPHFLLWGWLFIWLKTCREQRLRPHTAVDAPAQPSDPGQTARTPWPSALWPQAWCAQ